MSTILNSNNANFLTLSSNTISATTGLAGLVRKDRYDKTVQKRSKELDLEIQRNLWRIQRAGFNLRKFKDDVIDFAIGYYQANGIDLPAKRAVQMLLGEFSESIGDDVSRIIDELTRSVESFELK